MTQEAKIFQLEHGHDFTGTLRRKNADVGTFRYGIKTTERKAKTTVTHGIVGAEVQFEIETVEDVGYQVGDVIVLSHNGKRTRIVFCEAELLNRVQLRFVPYALADKIFTIGVANLEE